LETIPVHGRKGFTLVELLIAIVIFAVVISLVYGAYNATFTVIANANADSKYGERARITLERFVDDLEGFYLGSSGMLIGETASFGEYQGDSLRFTSRAHLVFNKNERPGGDTVISYRVEEDADTGLLRLFRVDEPVLPGVAFNADEQGFVFCEGLREVVFTYVDKDGNESEDWTTQEKTGDGKVELPRMVKLRIGFVSDEAENTILSFTTAVAIPQADSP